MPIRKHVNKDFFKTWSHEMAYVLGFFFADGTITINKNGSAYFVIQIADKKLLEEIRSVMASEHKIAKRAHRKDNSIFYRLQIGHQDLIESLYDLGLTTSKARRMRLPNIPQTFFGSFVLGYFDGDGNVWSSIKRSDRKNSSPVIQVGFTSGSGAFLEDLRLKLEEYTILGSCYHRKEKNVFRLQYSIKSSILLFHLMYKNASDDLFLERKKRIFEKFLDSKQLRS